MAGGKVEAGAELACLSVAVGGPIGAKAKAETQTKADKSTDTANILIFILITP